MSKSKKEDPSFLECFAGTILMLVALGAIIAGWLDWWSETTSAIIFFSAVVLFASLETIFWALRRFSVFLDHYDEDESENHSTNE